MAPTGSGAGEGEEKSAPQKHGYAPAAAFAPDGDVTSGAEEAEWCSEGQTKGGAGGAQWPVAGLSGRVSGLPAGRPGAAGPGERVGRGRGRELSSLEINSWTSPASCPASGALGSSGSARRDWLTGGLLRQLGRQLPWSERNARTLPRQTRASLSTISQLADSRAVLRSLGACLDVDLGSQEGRKECRGVVQLEGGLAV
uniref:Uncharacterized protein n=1 Tax=Rangifer tarandus platyrhynchus TaxID=3082113 RepID=A0ACB0F2N9_RANTA|nr:unnamed protein product [Rangifer tarandus platyrhynchus]